MHEGERETREIHKVVHVLLGSVHQSHKSTGTETEIDGFRIVSAAKDVEIKQEVSVTTGSK